MLTIARKKWFTWDYTVTEGSRAIADVALPRWRRDGTLTVEGVAYRVRREGWFRSDYLLESSTTRVARATRTSMVRQVFEIMHEGQRYELAKRSMFSGAFVLRRGSHDLGSVSRTGVFSRQASADFASDVPLAVQAFVVWLVVMSWKQSARAASAGA